MKGTLTIALVSFLALLMFQGPTWAEQGSSQPQPVSDLKLAMGWMMLGHFLPLKGQSSGDGKAKLSCTEGWLKKAVELQRLHIKDPASITEESQGELMRFLKNAQDCTETTPASLKSEGHSH